MRATLFNGLSDRLIVTFSFRQKGRVDFVTPTASQTFASRGFAQLAVTSKINDWFINPDTSALETVLQKLTSHYRAVHMVGFSMSGYGAFRFARAANASYILAVSLQFSIHPDVVPYDRRYRADADGFDYDLGDLTKRPCPDLQGIILVDPFRSLDLGHAHMLQELYPKVRLARLGFGGHPATGLLARNGHAGVVQRTALQSPPSPGPIIKTHRADRRGDEDYNNALAARLLLR
ncbi:MAG: alpha/beta hydrolase [Yoonia sp.]